MQIAWSALICVSAARSQGYLVIHERCLNCREVEIMVWAKLGFENWIISQNLLSKSKHHTDPAVPSSVCTSKGSELERRARNCTVMLF